MLEYPVPLMAKSGYGLVHRTGPLSGEERTSFNTSSVFEITILMIGPTDAGRCLLSGVKRTWLVLQHMSAYDPKRTFGRPFPSAALSRYDGPRAWG